MKTQDEMERTVNEAVDAVERECTSDKMTLSEAADYLDQVITRLGATLEAINDDIGEREDKE